MKSKAYGRFIDEHLLARTEGPSHAQIGLTNVCPQHCTYCYNRDRKGSPMETETILRVVRELKEMGVFWLGWTGGEPLLNEDIARITEAAAADCAVKLFTTGCTLTRQKAQDLKNAGLFSASVSLDHWQEALHDQNRGYPGAFRTALEAIRILQGVGGIHVGVSAVMSKDMLVERRVEEFLDFLEGLGIHEAWLSETKPSVQAFWNESLIMTEAERQYLVKLQDKRNARGTMTINYLGHFEGREHFGCNAGHKMISIDAFGGVSPCVFTPLNFGNVQEKPLAVIFRQMKMSFPSENACFMNKNFRLFQKYALKGEHVISGPQAWSLMREVDFGPYARFMELYYR